MYAAAHVAAFPDGAIDWESTMAFREHLWAHGFAVADAMDTAQRGMGLTWDQARELITYSAQRAAARDAPAQRDPAQRDSARGDLGHSAILACGAGTDQLAAGGTYRMGEIVTAYEEQLDLLESAGVQVILMASRAMAASTRSARDYLNVYGYLLGQADQPVILHWLGESFDPQLRGYWGAADFDTAADTVIELVRRAEGKVNGVKLSVLDPGHEVAIRRQLRQACAFIPGTTSTTPSVTGWPNWGLASLPPPSTGPGCTSPACAGAGSSRTRRPTAAPPRWPATGPLSRKRPPWRPTRSSWSPGAW